MAFYSPLPDGSYEVETDDGRKIRTAADEQMLMSMGVQPRTEQAHSALQNFDAENTVAKNDDPGNGRMFGHAYRPVPSENPVTDSIGQPGVKLVDREPVKTIPVAAPPQQAPSSGQGGGGRLDALGNLVASQLVTRTAPRRGAGEVPTSKTVTRAPVATQADLDTLAEQELGTEAMTVEQAQQGFDARGKMLEQAIAQNAHREQQLAEQAAKRQAVDAKMLELQTHAEQKEREVSEMQTLSPTDEYFKNAGGPWARVLAGIVTLIGGYGQALSAAGGVQTQNQGLAAIQAGIKERAEMLRQEYEQKKEAGRTARNAYSDYLQMYGTPENAMAALQDRGESIADQKLVIAAQQQGNQDALNQALQWQAQRSEERAKRIVQRNADAAGQVSQTFGYDRGTGGGSTLNMKAADMLLDIEKARGGGADDETQAYSKALQTEGIPQAEAKLGSVRDILSKMPKSGEVPTIESRNVLSRGVRSAADFVGGTGSGTALMDNQTERTVRGQFDRAKAEFRHALAGASLTTTEKTDFEGRFDTVNTAEGLRALADELSASIERKKAAIGAGFRQGVTQRYEERKQSLTPRSAPQGTRADE